MAAFGPVLSFRFRKPRWRAFRPETLRLLCLTGLAAFASLTPASGESRPIPLSHEQPDLTRVGKLDWRGGIALSGNSDAFGGLSALDIAADGRTLTAITDHGDHIRFALEHDSRGHLVAARLIAQAPLIGVDGQPFRRKTDRDAESLARLPDGSFVVAFEGRHRLLHYPAAKPDFSATPQWLTPPPGLRGTTSNGGIEALTAFANGRLLALTEKKHLNDGTLLGWTGDGRRWQALRYRAADSFSPTGAATLPDGDVVILERRFSALGGFAARLVRVTAGAIHRSAANFSLALQGEEIGRLEPPLNVDNFEGISARRAANGETLIYLVSDDNFFVLQRTLLMAFALREGAAGRPQR